MFYLQDSKSCKNWKADKYLCKRKCRKNVQIEHILIVILVLVLLAKKNGKIEDDVQSVWKVRKCMKENVLKNAQKELNPLVKNVKIVKKAVKHVKPKINVKNVIEKRNDS